jgi:hypothetical protein
MQSSTHHMGSVVYRTRVPVSSPTRPTALRPIHPDLFSPRCRRRFHLRVARGSYARIPNTTILGRLSRSCNLVLVSVGQLISLVIDRSTDRHPQLHSRPSHDRRRRHVIAAATTRTTNTADVSLVQHSAAGLRQRDGCTFADHSVTRAVIPSFHVLPVAPKSTSSVWSSPMRTVCAWAHRVAYYHRVVDTSSRSSTSPRVSPRRVSIR